MKKVLALLLVSGFLGSLAAEVRADMVASFSKDRHSVTMADGQKVSLEGLVFNENTVIPVMLFKISFKVESPEFEEIGMNRNRYGDLYAEMTNPEIGSLQQYLIEEGFAVYSGLGPYPNGLRAELLMAEKVARLDSGHSWARSLLLKASGIEGVWEGTGFRLVEGKVHSVANTKSGIYINFGADRDVDFTAQIGLKSKRNFKNMDWNYDGLVNKWVRMRGLVRNYNGPFMELYFPEQVELLDDERTN